MTPIQATLQASAGENKVRLPVVIWMNVPSFYQGDLFRALIASSRVELSVIFAKTLTEDRTALGWQNDLSGFPYHFLDRRSPVLDAIRLAWTLRGRIHVVNGIWAEPTFAVALVALRLVGAPYAIYSEAPAPTNSCSPSKRLLQATLGKIVVGKARGALTISHFSAEFFRALGARQEIIYPFAYFRSRATTAKRSQAAKHSGAIEVIFIGQLIPRKGIDLLLEAMLPLFQAYPDLILTVIGRGELLAQLREQTDELGLSQRVRFEGVLATAEIPDRLAAADVLVLPSRWDGWGLVVNEALSAGVPVIVSDRCGAADLVQSGINGYVFQSEQSADLRACLQSFLEKRGEWPAFKARAAAVGTKISAEVGASYLVNCLKHMTGQLQQRPVLPWLSYASVSE